MRAAERLDLPGTLKTELHASVVELTTGICSDVDEAIAALGELRTAQVLLRVGMDYDLWLDKLLGQACAEVARGAPEVVLETFVFHRARRNAVDCGRIRLRQDDPGPHDCACH